MNVLITDDERKIPSTELCYAEAVLVANGDGTYKVIKSRKSFVGENIGYCDFDKLLSQMFDKPFADYRHFYLYAKGWYARGDILEDMRILQSEYCGVDKEYLDNRVLVQFMTHLVCKHLKVAYKAEQFVLKAYTANTVEEYLEKCLSVLSTVKCKNDNGEIILNLGVPDPDILPLSKDGEAKQKCPVCGNTASCDRSSDV